MLTHHLHVEMMRFSMFPHLFHGLVQLVLGEGSPEGGTHFVVAAGGLDFYIDFEGFRVVVVVAHM